MEHRVAESNGSGGAHGRFLLNLGGASESYVKPRPAEHTSCMRIAGPCSGAGRPGRQPLCRTRLARVSGNKVHCSDSEL